MTESKSTLTRRDALKTLAALTGAVTLASLPNQWEEPVIEVGALPAHAQTSTTAAVRLINNSSDPADANLSGPTIDNTQTIASGSSYTWSNLPPAAGGASVRLERAGDGYFLTFDDESFEVTVDGTPIPGCTSGFGFALAAGQLRTIILTDCPPD